MTLLQKIVYVFLNNLAKLVLRIYFKKIVIVDKHKIPRNSATLIAPNHPNTMIDPVLMANIMPGWIHFLANYGLFKYPLSKFLMSKVFFSIPVKREKDVAEGEKVNNLTTIKICNQVLQNKGSIFMGPEGTSYAYRRIRHLKDGIARIALSAAKRKKFQSGIVIQPVGTNYSASHLFRSELVSFVGEPIFIDDYKDEFKKDREATAQSIMDNIRNQLESLTIHTNDEIENQLLRWSENLYFNNNSTPLFIEKLKISQLLLKNIRNVKDKQYHKFEEIWQQLFKYFKVLEDLKIDDSTINQKINNSRIHIESILKHPLNLLLKILMLIHCVWFLPLFVFKKLKLYIAYASMIKILVGLIFIPIYYSIILVLLYYFTNIKIFFTVLIALIITALIIMPLEKILEKIRKNNALLSSNRREELLLMRSECVELLQKEIFSV